MGRNVRWSGLRDEDFPYFSQHTRCGYCGHVRDLPAEYECIPTGDRSFAEFFVLSNPIVFQRRFQATITMYH